MTQLIDILRAGFDMAVAAGVVAVLCVTYWAHVPEDLHHGR